VHVDEAVDALLNAGAHGAVRKLLVHDAVGGRQAPRNSMAPESRSNMKANVVILLHMAITFG